MKNRLLQIVLCSLLLISLIGSDFTKAYAQGNTPDNTVTFAALGEQEIMLNGPIDSTRVPVILPAYWKLQSGSTLHLDLRAYIGGPDGTSSTSQLANAGFVRVYINNTWLDTITLNKNGDFSVDFKIPDAAWDTKLPNTPQYIRFELQDTVRCSLTWNASLNGNWRGISVAIRPTSFLVMPYQPVAVSTDLKNLPYPIYQGSFLPDNAVVVVGDQPTQGELQAAITTEAALGRLTGGKLNLKLTTASQLGSAGLANTQAIFVGNPANFSQLKDANLPAPVSGNGFSNPNISADDGVIQMVASPLDKTKAWLVISGHSDAGMIKAAQALGGGAIRPYGPSNLAIVTNVQPQFVQASATDFTLANLGYQEQTVSGFGTGYINYTFDVPADRVVSDGAFFDMAFANSALLNYQESGVSVTLNNEFVGSVRFNDKTTSTTTWKFNIPSYSFHVGRNTLLLQVELSAMSPCVDINSLWASVKPTSNFHLPLVPAPQNAVHDFDFNSYPSYLFSDFDKIAFVLSKNDLAGWNVAGQLAFDLGNNIGGSLVNPSVAYADVVPDTLLKEKAILLVGRPSTMPIMSKLTQVMPAPFQPGKDIASEPSAEYSFNVPANIPVGYLEVFASPWNYNYPIFAMVGNGGEGLTAASSAFLTQPTRGTFSGNLAVIFNNKIIASKVGNTSAQAQATPQVIQQPTAVSAAQTQSGPFQVNFMTAGLVIVGIIIVLGLIVYFVDARNKRKKV